MEDIESAEALDDRTIEVRLREPRSYFPYILASTWAFPRPKHRCEALGDDWRKPENLVTNGPFMLAELLHGGRDARREPALGRAARQREGDRDHVHVERADELVDEWIAGKLRRPPGPRPARRATRPTRSPISCPELSFTYVGFRPDTAPFSNELVRKAFSHAIDREAVRPERLGLVTAATKGGAIPPAMPGHSHKVAPSYDPELARQLLADAGYPDGKGLPPSSRSSSSTARASSPTASPSSGTRSSARASASATSEGHLWAADLGDAQLWLSGWTADYPDPDGFFRGLFKATGWPFYLDEEIEGILEQRPLAPGPGRADAALPRARPALGRASTRRSSRSSTAARCSSADRGSQGVWATPLTRLQLDEAVVLPHDESTPSPTPAEEAGRSGRRRPSSRPGSAPRRAAAPRGSGTRPRARSCGECGAISDARPPVAIDRAPPPSSARMRSTIPSTWPAKPKTTPDWSAAVVEVPIVAVGGDEVHLREPRGPREERVHRDLDPRREDAAHVLARRRDRVEVRGRPEVDDDARRAVALAGGDRVHDPVRADLARVVVADRDARLRPRPDDEERRLRVALGEAPCSARTSGGTVVERQTPVTLVEVEVAQLEQPADERAELVARALRLGRDAPAARRAARRRTARGRSACCRRRPRGARCRVRRRRRRRVSPSFSASASGVSAGSSPSPRSSSIVTSLDV